MPWKATVLIDRASLVALLCGVFVVFPVVVPGYWFRDLSLAPATYSGLAPKAVAIAVLAFLAVLMWMTSARDVGISGMGRAYMKTDSFVKLLLLLPLVMTGSVWLSHQNFSIAMVGTRERMDGVLVVGAWILLSVTLYRLLSRHSWALRASAWLALAGMIGPAVWTLLEAHGFQPLGLVSSAIPMVASAPRASFGHQAVAGSAFLVWAIASLGMASTCRGRLFWCCTGLFLLFVAALVGTGGRAAIAAGLLGVPATVFLLVTRSHLTWRSGLGMLATASIVAVVVVTTSSHAGQRVESIGSAARGHDASFNHRTITWRAGLRLLAQNPFVGLGPGMFSYYVWDAVDHTDEVELYLEFVPAEAQEDVVRVGRVLVFPDPESGRGVQVDANYDRAHNMVLDFALNYGGVSLLMLTLAAALALRRLLMSPHPVAIAVGGAMVAYLVYGQAWFMNVQVDPLVWSLAAVGLAMDAHARWANAYSEMA